MKVSCEFELDWVDEDETIDSEIEKRLVRAVIDKMPKNIMDGIEKKASDLIKPLLGRKKILFACRENACRSQMASAIAQYLAGDKLEVLNGGSQPADKINPDMIKVMHEKGIDMGFRTPQRIEDAMSRITPEIIVTMGCAEECPYVPGARMLDWDLPDPAGKPLDFMRQVRDQIESNVKNLIEELA